MSTEGSWFPVAFAADVESGTMIGTQAGDQPVAIYNVDGTFYATHNICTHQLAHLSDGWLEGCIVECPLHAGQFDVTTGKGLGPPIMCDIRTFPVRVVGDSVQVRVDPAEAAPAGD